VGLIRRENTLQRIREERGKANTPRQMTKMKKGNKGGLAAVVIGASSRYPDDLLTRCKEVGKNSRRIKNWGGGRSKGDANSGR